MLFHPRNDKSRNGAKGRGTYKFRSAIINPGEKNTPIPLHYERTRRRYPCRWGYTYIYIYNVEWSLLNLSPSFSSRTGRLGGDYQRDLASRIVSKRRKKRSFSFACARTKGESIGNVCNSVFERRNTQSRVFFRGRMCETTRRNARAVVKFIHRLQKNYLRSAAIREKVPRR